MGTFVPENGIIASGGTDLLAAGTSISFVSGGRVGVHS